VTKLAECVLRYRECPGTNGRYHGCKRSADSKGSEQLALLVKQREQIQETKEEKKTDTRKPGSAEETAGDARGHKMPLVTSATENVLMWWTIVRTS